MVPLLGGVTEYKDLNLPYLDGDVLVLNTEDFLKINGFDERFAHPSVGEDTDIEARLNRIGIYCKVERHIITVYHKWHKLNHSGAENNAQYFQENKRRTEPH